MSVVEMTEKVPHRRTGPIPRKYLDYSRGPARIIFGLLFVVYSGAATVVYLAGDLAPLTAWLDTRGYSFGTYGLSTIGALLIIFLEWLTAGTVWYWPVLVVDSWYTFWLTFPWFSVLWIDRLQPDWLALGVAGGGSILLAASSAYLGELLLFGKR